MNKNLIARTIVGGIIGGISGRLVHSLVQDSINSRKRVGALSAKLQADMDDFRNQMRTAGILAQAEANEEYRTMRRVDKRLEQYTEAELFWVLDRYDDKVADLDADVQMAEADAADEAEEADEVELSRRLEDYTAREALDILSLNDGLTQLLSDIGADFADLELIAEAHAGCLVDNIDNHGAVCTCSACKPDEPVKMMQMHPIDCTCAFCKTDSKEAV